jgi:hypothetical protein
MFIHTYDLKEDTDGGGDGPWHVAAFALPKNYKSIIEWCYQTFGTPDWNHLTKQTRWKNQIFYGEVYFCREEDLVLFLLRWA